MNDLRSAATATDVPDDIPAARYDKVKRYILSEIAAGRLKPMQRVLSESELTDKFGFARMTVNRALRELSAEGVLTRIAGVGTFVASVKSHSALYDLSDIKEEIELSGQRHAARVVVLEILRVSDEIATELELGRGREAFHSIIVHLENDVPIQVEERFVNPRAIPSYMSQDYQSITTRSYLVRVAPVSEVEHFIHAIHPKKELCKLLKIKPSEPCILMRRRIWSGQHVATSSRFIYPGSRYCLSSRHPVELRSDVKLVQTSYLDKMSALI